MAEVDNVLVEVLRLRGAEYVCLADRANGRIIGEAGYDDSASFSRVLKLETMVSEFLDPESDDDLDDLMISSHHWYHLIRHVNLFGTPPLLLYLRMRRSRANLAIARRELASAELKSRLVDILQVNDVPEYHDHDYDEDDATSIPGDSDHFYFTLSLQPDPADPAVAPVHHPDLTTGGASAPDPVLPPLPRRAPASSHAIPPERDPEPVEPGELPNVLRQGWAFDRNTMERLMHGLRRMMP